MSKGKVIFLYSTSGLSEQPFLDAGYEVHSFDGQNIDSNNGQWFQWFSWFDATDLRKQADEIIAKVQSVGAVGAPIVLVFGFPPCDDLAVSGSRHFKRKLEKNPNCQIQATERARLVEVVGNIAKCPFAAENPVSVLATLWRKCNFIFHPYEYGGYLPEDDEHPMYPEYINARDAYPKKTCLWTGNGFTMPPKRLVEVPRRSDGSVAYSEQYKKLGGKSLKTKNIRSASPRGFFEGLVQHMETKLWLKP